MVWMNKREREELLAHMNENNTSTYLGEAILEKHILFQGLLKSRSD
jgi:hypothetical protein